MWHEISEEFARPPVGKMTSYGNPSIKEAPAKPGGIKCQASLQTAFSSFYAGCSLPCLLVSLLLLLFKACACFGEWL